MLPDPILLVVTRVQTLDGAVFAWLRPARPCKVGKLLPEEPQQAGEAAPGVLVITQAHVLEPQVPAVVRVDPAATTSAADHITLGNFAFTGAGLPRTRDLGQLVRWLRSA